MDKLMVTATELISRETLRLEALSHNIANTATPGYKRVISFQQAASISEPGKNEGPGQAAGVVHATDFTSGKMVRTGDPLDIAIVGPGFFQIGTDDGIAYTRSGTFRRDAAGRLIAATGGNLLSSDGRDITVTIGDWSIEPNGTVIEQGVPIASIGIVEFESTNSLARKGDNLFLAPALEAKPSSSSTLAQGYKEMANVSVGNDMIQIMESMRRIESGQKVIHAYDDMIGTVLQRLGEM